MKNKFKYIGYAFGALLLLLLLIITIAGLVIPETQRITCTKSIDAPPYVVFKNISDFNVWYKWDPWYNLDCNQTRTIVGVAASINHQYNWQGNDKVGKGSMQIIQIDKNKKMTIALNFIEPFPSKATVEFDIESDGKSSNVSWTFISKNPFLLRFMSVIMKPMLIKSFDEGLSNLKTLSEKDALDHPASSSNESYEIQEMQLSSKTYLVIRNKQQSIKTISNFFMNEMPKAFSYLQKNKKELNGYPTGLYYAYDESKGICDVAIALPFTGTFAVSKPYEISTIVASKAISIDYYGAYDQMSGVYDALYDYIEKNNLEQQGPAIEEYIGDPEKLKGDMSKCLTRIAIPIK
ncbi:MAG: SRPBCC family protein [Bacteroidota bacterium]